MSYRYKINTFVQRWAYPGDTTLPLQEQKQTVHFPGTWVSFTSLALVAWHHWGSAETEAKGREKGRRVFPRRNATEERRASKRIYDGHRTQTKKMGSVREGSLPQGCQSRRSILCIWCILCSWQTITSDRSASGKGRIKLGGKERGHHLSQDWRRNHPLVHGVLHNHIQRFSATSAYHLP